MNHRRKYTDEQITSTIAASTNMRGVLRILGARQAGGSYQNIRRRAAALGLDLSHFPRGLHHAKGLTGIRLRPDQILTKKDPGRLGRTSARQLRRALTEVGVPYRCCACGIPPEWNGQPLTLDVDHVNGDWNDDRQENLRFLCPNCHSQQPSSRPPRKQQPQASAKLRGVDKRAKLTAEDVVAIRQSPVSAEQLAKLYPVAPQTINKIRRGVIWKDVPAMA
ncbi:HNH endonuclease signature motif containing protein [Dactylosporangium sp. McL0621]|uniref:HNH endonuclease signature motif containing protein n=1 Tax=Dactylosporangium sp. McL0621 TaxID=3415678 RepID=UPI003CF8695C